MQRGKVRGWSPQCTPASGLRLHAPPQGPAAAPSWDPACTPVSRPALHLPSGSRLHPLKARAPPAWDQQSAWLPHGPQLTNSRSRCFSGHPRVSQSPERHPGTPFCPSNAASPSLSAWNSFMVFHHLRIKRKYTQSWWVFRLCLPPSVPLLPTTLPRPHAQPCPPLCWWRTSSLPSSPAASSSSSKYLKDSCSGTHPPWLPYCHMPCLL